MKNKIPEDGPGRGPKDFLEDIGFPAEVVNHIDANFQQAHKYAEMVALQRGRLATKIDRAFNDGGMSLAAGMHLEEEGIPTLTTSTTDPESDAIMAIVVSKVLVERMVLTLKEKYSGDEIRAIVGAIDHITTQLAKDLLGK